LSGPSSPLLEDGDVYELEPEPEPEPDPEPEPEPEPDEEPVTEAEVLWLL
jgi:outer membrane biosynthesis protein TonB